MQSEAAPRERLTARVVLLDPSGRLLLMKGRLPSRPNAPGPGSRSEAAPNREKRFWRPRSARFAKRPASPR